jgi:predicted amidophosphoribosyltransferase
VLPRAPHDYLARLSGAFCCFGLVQGLQNTLLTLPESWVAVRGAFETGPGSQVDNLRVLLLHHVMTTGATLDACSKALRDAGAKSVVALTVARAAHNPLPGAGES